MRRTFYASCNSINNQAKSLDEILQLTLHESYCLPLLTYATPALSLSAQQLKDLNVCWNTVYRLIFKFNRWESVKSFICGHGRLNLIHIIIVRKINFFDHLRSLYCSNVALYRLFWINFTDSCLTDKCTNSVFLPKQAAVANVYSDFRELCFPE